MYSQSSGYIEYSRSLLGGSIRKIIVDNGDSYLLGTSQLYKIGPTGNTIWGRSFPTGTNTYLTMVLDNGIIHLLGFTNVTTVPVTDGSVAHGGGSDILYTKMDANTGNTLHNGYLGGSGAESTGLGLAVENGNTYISYATNSPDIPITTGPAYNSGYDMVMTKLDASAHVVYSTYIGKVGNAFTGTTSFVVENGAAYLAFVATNTHAFATTDGSASRGADDLGFIKLDASGNRLFSFIIGGSLSESMPAMAVDNGMIYLTNITRSSNYPVTDGSYRQGTGSLFWNVTLTKFNSNGTIAYSGYRAGTTNAFRNTQPDIRLYNGALYLAGKLGGTTGIFTRTDNSTGNDYLFKINPSDGAVLFAKSVVGTGGVYNNQPLHRMEIADGSIYIVTHGGPVTAVTTNGTTRRIVGGTYVVKLSAVNGQLEFASFEPGSANGSIPYQYDMAVSNGKIFVFGANNQDLNILLSTPPGSRDDVGSLYLTAYNFCPPTPSPNTILPLTQTICKEGFTQTITGSNSAFGADQLPTLYYNGIPEKQNEIKVRYQWQVADNAAGPWVNAGGVSTQKDFSPPTGSADKYYRRQALAPLGCSPELVSTSGVAAVLVSADNAPVVTSDIFNTCVGTPVDISATVSGGTAPYTYVWDNGVASTTNSATITPAGNAVYTLTVTDDIGCKQASQAVVNAYTADAGPATAGACANQPVRIGTSPPAGLAGVVYSWLPTTGLDDPSIAQPLANPAGNTTYTLSMTVPISGGGTCTTTDDITVNVVAAPTAANFAGVDRVICRGGTTTLGGAGQSGFAYAWVPGAYLSATNTAAVTFDAGGAFPVPNAFTYTLSASSLGCVFTDQVTVAVIQANAGTDYCGPRTVGVDDPTPGITGKTFLWEVVSGPGSITGATNTPRTSVSASIGATTVYRLTVSYNGTSCIDLVSVPDCAGGDNGCPSANIKVDAQYSCPSTNFGAVTLSALPANLPSTEWTYSWSSSTGAGISSTVGEEITITDNIAKTVTLRITSVDNPALSCSKTITVNDPSWALPVFAAPDQSICPGASVAIGQPAIGGYSYAWEQLSGGAQSSSNPTVTPDGSTSYAVTVKDNAGGCTTDHLVTVEVKPVTIDPGADWNVCSSTMVTLGSPALPNSTYSWLPGTASYQQGTDENSAEPKVLIAASQDFTLTVTDTETGCSADSTIHIVLDNGSSLPSIDDKTICKDGEGVQIGNKGMPGVTYSWLPVTGLSSATDAQPLANPTATTLYTVTAQFYDQLGAPTCTKTGTVTVTVNDPQITMADDVVCPSGALYDLSTGISVTGATAYSWRPALLVTTPTDLNTTVRSNPTAPATYTLIAKDANGCADTASRTLTPSFAAPIAGGNAIVCLGSTLDLGHSSNSGSISWTVSPALAGTISSTSSPAPVFTPAAGDVGKTFKFIISQDIAGCINTDSVNIAVRGFQLAALTTQTVCNNSSATIGVTSIPGYTYQWTPSAGLENPSEATTVVNNVMGTTAYTLTATDASGCSANTLAVVGVNPESAPDISIPDVTAAFGGSAPPFNPQVTGSPAPYTYIWTPAATLDNPYIANATATPVSIGTTTYSLNVTDANGCTSSAPANLMVKVMGTLPVQLSSITARNRDCSVVINWKVESAENFSSFVVERSNDGIRYDAIATVYYNVNRSAYSYSDAMPGSGTWKYRLKLIDIDGGLVYSSVLAARVNCAEQATISVYPNPVSNIVYIKSSKAISKIMLLSITGQTISQLVPAQSQPGIYSIPVGNKVVQGLYILQVTATDGAVQNSKLIKE